jgi:hypothetical protein
MKTLGYAAHSLESSLALFHFERRDLRPNDVAIEILYCGICHSDLHQARDDWGTAKYPMIPGHEIIGRVIEVGSDVTKYKVGDNVAVGCIVDSCRECDQCKAGDEQHYRDGMTVVFNSEDRVTGDNTYGGFSKHIVVREEYVLSVPDALNISRAAPILCAGITTYAPLKNYHVGPGSRVGVVGLDGLGHPDTPVSGAPPLIPISGKIFLEAGKQYNIELKGMNLMPTFFYFATALQVSWASLQPLDDLATYDAVVLAVGGNEQYDGERRDRSFRLPELQDDLIGDVNPSGKLPITMEKRIQDNLAFATFPTDPDAQEIKYSEGLFVGYRGYEKNRIEPQYPFGYGLSYTKFRYSHLNIDPKVLKDKEKKDKKKSSSNDDDLIRVSFTVTNVGNRAGAEIAQLYVAPVNPPVERPRKELKGFQKVYLEPGESRKVTITLDRRSLAYFNVKHKTWDVAKGVYRILVGSSSENIELQKALVNVISQ